MTNEEMRKAMEFIVKMDSQTVIKLDRLGKKVRAIKVTQGRFEKRWKETEKRIRALLAKAETTERRIAAQKRSILASGKAATDRRLGTVTDRRPKTATDRRLEALADLVERHISERQGKP